MDCEVAVVGGGIGGLTVAAVLAKRGVDVCLLERESQVGGCAASVEKFGYKFDPTDGLNNNKITALPTPHGGLFGSRPSAPGAAIEYGSSRGVRIELALLSTVSRVYELCLSRANRKLRCPQPAG